MKKYFESTGLVYNKEENMYETGQPSKTNDVKNIAKSAASTVLTGRTTVYYSLSKGLGYEINDNQLIIKACFINYKMGGMKQPVEMWFYKELKNGFFKELQEKGLKFVGKGTEKIDDPKGQAAQKKVLIICGMIIVFLILLVALL